MKSLYGRISALYLLLALVLAGLCAWLSIGLFVRFHNEVDQKVSLKLAQTFFMHMQPTLEAGAYQAAVDEAAELGTMFDPALELYLLDAEGVILAHSPPPEKVLVDRVSLEPIRQFLAKAPLPIEGDAPCLEMDRRIFSAYSFEQQGGEEAFVYVIIRGKAAGTAGEMVRDSYIVRTAGLTFLVVVGLTALVGLMLFGLLTRRFRRLVGVGERFEAGDFSPRIEDESDDELGRLARLFNRMGGTITAQMEALRRTDAQRRDLVANLAHDLRTPLSAVRGYAERLRDRSLPAAEQTRHADLVLTNADRAVTLVRRLNDLSRLDARQSAPLFEPFSLAELVQDLAHKFAPDAERNELDLVADYSPDLPMIEGDVGLVDRMVSNLLENAIRYTP
ncbi:MAG: histidine kinase dimerization/phospho-acceptor domain-containing protein, partial [Bacteroidota bacterium]